MIEQALVLGELTNERQDRLNVPAVAGLIVIPSTKVWESILYPARLRGEPRALICRNALGHRAPVEHRAIRRPDDPEVPARFTEPGCCACCRHGCGRMV